MITLIMLIGSVTAWESGILSYHDSPNITNKDEINHMDILNRARLLRGMPFF